jgi:hypothetical protein
MKLTVVGNLESAEPAWFGPDRKQETLDEFLPSGSCFDLEQADIWPTHFLPLPARRPPPLAAETSSWKSMPERSRVKS